MTMIRLAGLFHVELYVTFIVTYNFGAHFRLGVPLNAFTGFKWVVELITVAAIVYMVRMNRQKARG